MLHALAAPFTAPIAHAAPGDEYWGDRFIPGGTLSSISTLVADGSGNLYVGGSFTTIGGVSANYIVRWNGSTWSALSSGMNGPINALAVDSSGRLYAGGSLQALINETRAHRGKKIPAPQADVLIAFVQNVIAGL